MDVQRPTEEELREYFAGLAEELNLRLLLEALEQENGYGVKNTLWVEGIALTSYEKGQPARGLRRLLRAVIKFLRKKV